MIIRIWFFFLKSLVGKSKASAGFVIIWPRNRKADGFKGAVCIFLVRKKKEATWQLCHSPILRTCCEVSQNSAIKYSSGNNSPFLFAMVLPPESNRTLMSVFLPSIIHADNLPVLVSVTKINCHLTHIHPSHIVIIRLNNNSSNNK